MKSMYIVLVEDEKLNIDSAIHAVSVMFGSKPHVHYPGDGNFYDLDKNEDPIQMFVARTSSAAYKLSEFMERMQIGPDCVLMDLNYPYSMLVGDKFSNQWPPKPFGFADLFMFLGFAPKCSVMVTSGANHGGSLLPLGLHTIDGVLVQFVSDMNEVKDWLTPLREVWKD
jgi:CheY-like chemotaxis protein